MSESPLEGPLGIYAPFNAREMARLRGFAADVEELAASSFFENPGTTLTMSGGKDQALVTEIEYAGEEAVRAVVPTFRRLYSHSEDTSFAKVFTLLAAHVMARGSDQTSDALRALKGFRMIEREMMRSVNGGGLDLNGQELTPRVIVDLFLNGQYLHREPAKADKLAQWPVPDLLRHDFFTTLVRLLNLYWVAANVVRLILAEPELARNDSEPPSVRPGGPDYVAQSTEPAEAPHSRMPPCP